MLENTLKTLITNGWADVESGDVEAPTGYFAIVTIRQHVTHEELREFNTLCGEDEVYPAAGHYFTLENSYGTLIYLRYDSLEEAQRAFQAHDDAYGLWDQEVVCEWWAGCTNPATHYTPHPVLGQVPTCSTCAEKIRRLS